MEFVQEFVSGSLQWIDSGGPPLKLALLLLGGICVHFILALTLRHMHKVAAESVQRWDDVVLSALESPLRTVLWVFVASRQSATLSVRTLASTVPTPSSSTWGIIVAGLNLIFIELEEAKRAIINMHGKYRIPTLLKEVDTLCRGK